jgi:hypothetical protein
MMLPFEFFLEMNNSVEKNSLELGIDPLLPIRGICSEFQIYGVSTAKDRKGRNTLPSRHVNSFGSQKDVVQSFAIIF